MGRKDQQMIFEEVKSTETKPNGEILALFESFLATDIDTAEVKDWEGDYKTIESLYSSCKHHTAGAYKGKVKAIKNGNHVYLERVVKK